MSVINRMLRDLDERQQQIKNQTYTPAAVAPQPIHWLWIVAIVVISAAVIVGTLNLWWMYSDKATPNEGEQIVDVQSMPNQPTSIATLPKSESKPEPQPVNKEPVKPADETPKQAQAIVDVRALEQIQEQAAEAEPAQQQPAQQQPEKQEPVAVAKPKPKPEPVEKESSFAVTRVQLSPTELAEANLAKAREALAKGEQSRGQELLEKALMVKPDHVIVRSELAAYWYGRGMASRALTLLQQGLDMKPQQSEWQLLYARMLERIGRVEQAYTALITIDSNAAEVQELLKLRAAAATQLGYFSEAAADYTALAAEYGEQRWWLAAAVAYEDGDNIDAAVRCYRQALQYPELGNDARAYIEQRLNVLEGY